jgi:hypothetical protein
MHGRDHHIGRLQIAVDDALLVCGRERIGERDADVADLRDGQPSGAHPQAETVTLHQLHCDEADAIGFLHRVDGDDVRMVQGRDSLRFTLKALEASGVLREGGRQHLQRDPPVERQVFGHVDFAHAAGAKLADDAVVGERLPGL